MPRASGFRLATLILALGACGGPPTQDLRFWTDDVALRVSSDPLPPRATERVVYRITLRDKTTGEPIESGEGQIFATSRDQANTWDSFTPGPELGTYYAKLRFITAGEWAVAIRFRRDSTKQLDRVDWRQEVRASRDPGA